MAEFIEDDLEERFALAAEYLPSIVGSLKSDQLLKFYATYKQATVGKCNTPSPYWYNFQNKQKWDAWKALGDLSQEDAMRQYVEFLDEVSPDWEEDIISKRKDRSVSVSTMLPQDSEIDESDKNMFDWVRDGNIEKIKIMVKSNNINELDENGMSLLHWAADRGLTDMVSCLLDLGSNIDQRDSVGQTALHYACCCGHLETTKLLLQKGAKRDVVCVEGLTPLDLANDEIKELFTLAST